MLRTLSTWTGPQGAPYFHQHYFGGSSSGEAAAAVAAVSALWQDLAPNLSSVLIVNVAQEVEVVDIATGQVTAIHVTAGATHQMSETGEILPTSQQALVRWRTGVFVAGREIRGRMFVPGMMEADSVVGLPSTGIITAFNTAAADFLTAGSGAGGFVIYSPTHREAAAVVSASTWSQWAVLRSRRD